MKRALAIVAHPDDVEFYAAGTLLQLADAGYEIHFWNLADGCMGSKQIAAEPLREMRAAEAARAARLAGAVLHPPIFRDMDIRYGPEGLARATAVIRSVRPDILFTHCPHDYMEDHEAACRLAVSAAFARSMANFPTDPDHPAVADPLRIYHLMPHSALDYRGDPVRAGLLVDVGSVWARKAALLACHESQNQWLGESQGMASMESGMRAWAQSLGAQSGRFALAEGFIRHHHIGFCEPDFDPLLAALPDSAVIRP